MQYVSKFRQVLNDDNVDKEAAKDRDCPVCGGDCSSANPPMGDACPATRRYALAVEAEQP